MAAAILVLQAGQHPAGARLHHKSSSVVLKIMDQSKNHFSVVFND